MAKSTIDKNYLVVGFLKFDGKKCNQAYLLNIFVEFKHNDNPLKKCNNNICILNI